MKTDDLIRQLAAEPMPRRGWSLERRLGLAAAIGFATVLVMVLAGLGIRPDLAETLLTPTGALKIVGATAIAAAGFRVACRLGRPGTSALCPFSAALFLVPVAVTAFALTGPGVGLGIPAASVLACIGEIFLLAILPLAASLVALQSGAPTRPAASGAVAGLLAGGLAAAGFALACPMNDAGRVAAGYGAAILLLSALGAVAGRRVLAW